MRDKDLYSQILGIKPPWYVEDVKLDIETNKVEIFIAPRADAVLVRPHCHQPSPGYDQRERRWRHLDTCLMQAMLVADIPRVDCVTHGVTTLSASLVSSLRIMARNVQQPKVEWG